MIGAVIVGFFAGLLARAIKPGDDAMGWFKTIILGISGAFVGNWLASMLGIGKQNGIMGLAVAVVGAIVILFAFEMISGKGNK